MKLVVQRVKHASVKVEGEIKGQIGQGFLVLLGVKKGDKIVYKEYSTTEIKLDDKDYIILKEEDVLATL